MNQILNVDSNNCFWVWPYFIPYQWNKLASEIDLQICALLFVVVRKLELGPSWLILLFFINFTFPVTDSKSQCEPLLGMSEGRQWVWKWKGFKKVKKHYTFRMIKSLIVDSDRPKAFSVSKIKTGWWCSKCYCHILEIHFSLVQIIESGSLFTFYTNGTIRFWKNISKYAYQQRG